MIEMEEKIIQERERCKDVVILKINALLEVRKKYQRNRRLLIVNKLRDDIIFSIDNPEYVKMPLKQVLRNREMKKAAAEQSTKLHGDVVMEWIWKLN